MKKFSKALFVLSLLAAVMLGGNAWAFNATDHVSVAPNDKGDLLLFPAYFTGGGWETKLTVVNTSLTHSVVAKVVFRSVVSSIEVRDFIIYLSPTDVWTGIVNERNGLAFINSTDDSVRNLAGNFASSTAPLDVNFEVPCTDGDVNTTGYVEVIEGAAFDLGDPPVLKSAIRDRYTAWLSEIPNNPPLNVLAGFAEIRNPQNGLGFSINATAMKNYDNFSKIEVGIATLLGQEANNLIGEIEAALSKNDIVIPYYAGSRGGFLGTITFPTKLAFPIEPVDCLPQPVKGPYNKFPTPTFTAAVFDLSENTFTPVEGECLVSPCIPEQVITNSFPQELNFIAGLFVDVDFEEGWILIQMDDSAPPTSFNTFDATDVNGTYTGAPAIATFLRFDQNGFSTWAYAPHTLGTVSIGTADQGNQYHFWEQTDN